MWLRLLIKEHSDHLMDVAPFWAQRPAAITFTAAGHTAGVACARLSDGTSRPAPVAQPTLNLPPGPPFGGRRTRYRARPSEDRWVR